MFQRVHFVDRLNRFVVLCEAGGQTFPAHLPNPGRLWEILLPGRVLLLEKRGKGRMPRVWGALLGEEIVCLHTSFATSVAQKLLEERSVRGLEDFEVERREVSCGGYRLDFLLQRGRERLFLEVKSCTLFFDGLAMFPDAVTVRGRRHVELLENLGGTLLFIVHHPLCFAFLPDFHTDPGFSSALYAARTKILIQAIAVRWEEDGSFQYVRHLPIPWSLYEREAQNRGSYLLFGYLPKSEHIHVGNLGECFFPEGFYIYVGSAMQFLSQRIQRHLRGNKKNHWHIDFFLPFLRDIRALPVRSSERLECAIAQELGKIAQVIPHFGSSDCSCAGHLFFMPGHPLKRASFVNLLLHFRMGRIADVLRGLREGKNLDCWEEGIYNVE